MPQCDRKILAFWILYLVLFCNINPPAGFGLYYRRQFSEVLPILGPSKHAHFHKRPDNTTAMESLTESQQKRIKPEDQTDEPLESSSHTHAVKYPVAGPGEGHSDSSPSSAPHW